MNEPNSVALVLLDEWGDGVIEPTWNELHVAWDANPLGITVGQSWPLGPLGSLLGLLVALRGT